MTKLGLKKIEAVIGKQEFHELTINGKGQMTLFAEENKLDPILKSELKALLARMNLVANLNSLPQTKFKNITPEKEKIPEFEIKTKNLRAYLFHITTSGKIVTVVGHKNNQKKDITRFRSLKAQYLNLQRNDNQGRINKK